MTTLDLHGLITEFDARRRSAHRRVVTAVDATRWLKLIAGAIAAGVVVSAFATFVW